MLASTTSFNSKATPTYIILILSTTAALFIPVELVLPIKLVHIRSLQFTNYSVLLKVINNNNITPLIINNLGGRHICTPTHAHTRIHTILYTLQTKAISKDCGCLPPGLIRPETFMVACRIHKSFLPQKSHTIYGIISANITYCLSINCNTFVIIMEY